MDTSYQFTFRLKPEAKRRSVIVVDRETQAMIEEAKAAIKAKAAELGYELKVEEVPNWLAI